MIKEKTKHYLKIAGISAIWIGVICGIFFIVSILG